MNQIRGMAPRMERRTGRCHTLGSWAEGLWTLRPKCEAPGGGGEGGRLIPRLTFLGAVAIAISTGRHLWASSAYVSLQ